MMNGMTYTCVHPDREGERCTETREKGGKKGMVKKQRREAGKGGEGGEEWRYQKRGLVV